MYIFTIIKIRTVMDSVHRSSSSSSSVSAMLHSPSSPRSPFINLITKAKGRGDNELFFKKYYTLL